MYVGFEWQPQKGITSGQEMGKKGKERCLLVSGWLRRKETGGNLYSCNTNDSSKQLTGKQFLFLLTSSNKKASYTSLCLQIEVFSS